jgi:hypothetical protein
MMLPDQDIHQYTVPYVYHEFPRLLYGPRGETRLVENAEEQEAAIKAGFSPDPRRASATGAVPRKG